MSLGGALQIGRTGLMASQAAIEVAGNNLANIATRGYHRKEITLVPAPAEEIQAGIFSGRGVQVKQIVRQVNEALEARLRGGISDHSRSLTQRDLLSQIEAIENEFSDVDLSTQLVSFFNVWSQLANDPQNISLRSLVMQEGVTLASFIRGLRNDLTEIREQADQALDGATLAANNLLLQIEKVNLEIMRTERGQGGAHGLRDQRDVLLGELAKYLDISTIEQPGGAIDVFVGSTPIILIGRSRGIEVRKQTINNQLQIEVIVSDDSTVVKPTSGQIGALIKSRGKDVNSAVDFLDDFTTKFIFEINRLHSQGQGLRGHEMVFSTNRVTDPALSLNDSVVGLDFVPQHGSFRISVTNKITGQRVTHTIDVDLDGLTDGVDTTLTSLAAALGSSPGVLAEITPAGILKISGVSGDYQVSFSDDTSGILAALGINSFFVGSQAVDIDVNQIILDEPSLLSVGRGHLNGDNRTALALAGLRDEPLDAFNGMSITEAWGRHVEDYAIRLNRLHQQVDADSVVLENLEAQQQRISGVNADEATIDLLSFQRTYQASARFLSVVDELLETLLSIV